MDFSLLKGIDFTRPDNLIFLSIFLVIAIIIFSVFFAVITRIFRAAREFFIGEENEKPRLSKTSGADRPQQKKTAEDSEEIRIKPKVMVMGGDYNKGLDNDKEKDEGKDIAKNQREKDEKNIAEGLSKLKSGGVESENTLESKMPSRLTESEEEGQERIIIPTPKRFPKTDGVGVGSAKGGGSGPGMPTSTTGNSDLKKVVMQPGRAGVTTPGMVIDSAGQARLNMGGGNEPAGVVKFFSAQNQPSSQQTNFSNQKDNKKVSEVAGDQSIFKGRPEISKKELAHKMRIDPKIWQAEKQVGLTLNPIEREKLVKEVFSPALGTNISKTDLKSSIQKLNRKMLGTTNAVAHAKIRKEIKFFKKIGGIK